MREGAGHHLRDSLYQVDVGGPLGDSLVVASRAECRRHPLASRRLAAGEEQYGDRVGEGLRDASEGVLGARAALHGEDADLPAVGYPAESVGHVYAGALLAADDRPDALLGAGLYQRLVGIAGHPLDALGLQYLRDDRVAVHVCAPCWCVALWPDWNARRRRVRRVVGHSFGSLAALAELWWTWRLRPEKPRGIISRAPCHPAFHGGCVQLDTGGTAGLRFGLERPCGTGAPVR